MVKYGDRNQTVMGNPTVFISYSHDSPEHADHILKLSNRLREEGIDSTIDQYEESPPEGWPKWMDRQIENSDFILVVCTEIYYKRVMGTEEEGKGQGVRWESTLTYQHLYDAGGENTRFIPVLFQSGKVEHIPKPLGGATRYRVDTDRGYEDLYRRLTNQPRARKPRLGKQRSLPSRERKTDFFELRKIMLSKLPVTGPDLFGRDNELSILNDAWSDQHTHILSLVAWGGVGKSALVNEWLNQMEQHNYRGAEKVYGWSFYSQGTREDKQASADEFLAYALEWFGDPDSTQGSPWDKGVRLAGLVRKQRTLLILDGMEPLQYPPGEMHGRLKDQGLQALLRELSHSNPGLCIITTRLEVKDIENCVGSTVKRIDLEHLSEDAGAQLLKKLGVHGTPIELQEASRDFKGHALALNLLGTYLATVHDGEIRKRDLIARLTDEEEKGGHAKRVMESYERLLEGKPELNILYLMGLFDRPSEGEAIDVLKEKPAIIGLTEKIQNLAPAEWKYALKHLQELRLLAKKDENRPDILDCHPLTREHFGEKLQNNNPKAWKDAHSRLYKYYKNLPEKELPDTLEEMEPLFAAVAHGCQAGLHQEVLSKVYWPRICRELKFYTTKKLGAFSADLVALSSFYRKQWFEQASGLTEHDKASVFGWTGYALLAIGRLRDAVQPMKIAFNNTIKQKNWYEVAKNALNLSELYLTLGKVEQAVEFAHKGVTFADRNGDTFLKMACRSSLADALHQAGELESAENLFQEAEEIQKKRQPDYPYLYAMAGFRFCNLLLDLERYHEVLRRIEQVRECVHKNHDIPIFFIVLDYLSFGRAIMFQNLTEETCNFIEGKPHLDKAVEGLRKGNRQDHLPRGLLARAVLYRLQKDFTNAWNDLEEAQEIAERGDMKLHLADYHLEACRVCLAERKMIKAGEHLETAREMIGEMGYHRRDGEVEELEEQLGEME